MHLAIKSILATIVLLTIVSWTPAASAQQRYPYRPATPPISPYFDLLRDDTGGIPSYQAFLRPEQEYRQFLGEQLEYQRTQSYPGVDSTGRSILLRRDTMLDGVDVSQELRYRAAFPRGSRSTAGRFLDYSHYYGDDTSRSANVRSLSPRAIAR